MNKRKKSIIVPAQIDEIYQVEAFVEKICDDYNIFSSYFGNIMFAVTETFRFAVEKHNQNVEAIKISFFSVSEGLIFQISLGDRFLEIAALLNRNIEEDLEAPELDEKARNIMIIRMLSDNIRLDHSKNMVELVFYISSINQQLTNERLKELDNYYQKLLQEKLV